MNRPRETRRIDGRSRRDDVTPIARAAHGADDAYRRELRVPDYPPPLRASEALARRQPRRGRIGGIFIAILAAVALWWLSTSPWLMLTSETASNAVDSASNAVNATRDAIADRIDAMQAPSTERADTMATSKDAAPPELVESTLRPTDTAATPPVPETNAASAVVAPTDNAGSLAVAPTNNPAPVAVAPTNNPAPVAVAPTNVAPARPSTAAAAPPPTAAVPATSTAAMVLPSTSVPAAAAPPAASTGADARAVLIERADAMNAKGAYVTPTRSNAAALYVAALTADPSDAATRAKLDAIVAGTAQTASEQIVAFRFERARDLMDHLATAVPERAHQYVSSAAMNKWRVVDLLLAADAKMQTYSITTPRGDNAISLLQEAQRIDPRNPIADEMLAKAYGMKQQQEQDAANPDTR